MKMYTCPNCNHPGISAWRKSWLGPAKTIACKQCGKKVGVPYSAVFAVTPFIIAIILSGSVHSIPLKILIWLIGIIVMAIIHLKWVPLIPK